MKTILLAFSLSLFLISCKSQTLQTVLDGASEVILSEQGQPSQAEIGLGLKEALSVSIEKGAQSLAQKNGFLGNELVKIVLPPEVQEIQKTLDRIGLGALSDELTVKLNRAAEDAALKSVPIFKSAILQMKFQDVMSVLTGTEHAATDYLKSTTSNEILKAFAPQISKSLNKVGAPQLWAEIFGRYNSIPFVKKVDTDLVAYTNKRALSGLFQTVSKREEAIRGSVSQRTSPLLRKVFSYADSL